MSISAARESGFLRREKRASPPRHGSQTALPPPGARENTRPTVTASGELFQAQQSFGFFRSSALSSLRCPRGRRFFVAARQTLLNAKNISGEFCI